MQKARGGTRAPGCKLALYSHETMGLGHIRRNLLIAGALSHSPDPTAILLLAGAREAGAFTMPPGVDCLTLPSLHKNGDGTLEPRCLGVSLEELFALRGQTMRAALESFAPDVLIVDKVPRGAGGELEDTLRSLRKRGQTRCVLGLRDVLDDPTTVRDEWQSERFEDAVDEFYDQVWIYGDPQVYDATREYEMSLRLADKVRFTGYLNRSVPVAPRDESLSSNRVTDEAPAANLLATLALPPGKMVLCVVGGGQDGARLAEAFADVQLPPHTNGVLVTGPFMSPSVRQHLHGRAAANSRLRVLEFVTNPEALLSRADRVICMGGYNTICEVLSYGKPALVVPRIHPRREQLVRAHRLRDLRLLDMLLPDQADAAALSRWLAHDVDLPALRHLSGHIDFGGLERLPFLLKKLLCTPPSYKGEAPVCSHETAAFHTQLAGHPQQTKGRLRHAA